MENKQTAVEWLENKLKTYLSWSSFLEEDFEQAKEMEKDQVLDAYSQCWIDNFMPTGNPTRPAIDYYNETFNKEQ